MRECAVEGCGRRVRTKGLCQRHYVREWRMGRAVAEAKPIRPCTEEGCLNDAHAKGLCRRHYGQVWRNGRVLLNQDHYENTSKHIDDPRDKEILEQIRQVDRDLRGFEEVYERVVGWRRRLEVKTRMDDLRVQRVELAGKLNTVEAPKEAEANNG